MKASPAARSLIRCHHVASGGADVPPSGRLGAGVPASRPQGGSRGAPAPLGKKGRYSGQSPAKVDLRDTAAMLLPDEAVSSCGHRLAPGWECYGERAGVLQKGRFGAFFAGVIRCGSVWHCPVCAAKICRRRMIEVALSSRKFMEAGGNVGLLTLTLGHDRDTPLSVTKDQLRDMWADLKDQRFWKEARKAGEIAGGITGKEVTDGDNGWHPHLHVLLYLMKGLSVARLCELWNSIETYWRARAERDGFRAGDHAVDVRIAHHARVAGEYIAKFGVEWELTHGHTKQGKKGSRTPWDLLRDAAGGDARARVRFVEYAEACKGDRQLVPFGCVRKEWGKTASDEDAANAPEQANAQVICAFPQATIDVIREKRLSGRVLEAANVGGLLAVQAVLANYGAIVWPGVKASQVPAWVLQQGRKQKE